MSKIEAVTVKTDGCGQKWSALKVGHYTVVLRGRGSVRAYWSGRFWYFHRDRKIADEQQLNPPISSVIVTSYVP